VALGTLILAKGEAQPLRWSAWGVSATLTAFREKFEKTKYKKMSFGPCGWLATPVAHKGGLGAKKKIYIYIYIRGFFNIFIFKVLLIFIF
jgi:hypothetical protein